MTPIKCQAACLALPGLIAPHWVLGGGKSGPGCFSTMDTPPWGLPGFVFEVSSPGLWTGSTFIIALAVWSTRALTHAGYCPVWVGRVGLTFLVLGWARPRDWIG